MAALPQKMTDIKFCAGWNFNDGPGVMIGDPFVQVLIAEQ